MTENQYKRDTFFILRKPLDMPIESSASELKKACREAKSYSHSQEIFARWPNLRDASQRMTSLLTRYWPDPRKQGDKLLINCLSVGFLEAEKAMRINNNDLSEQKAFIKYVSEELVQCLGLTLMIKRKQGCIVYDPVSGYLDTVINSPQNNELIWVDEPHVAFKSSQSKLLCASRVFTLIELRLAGLLD